MFLCFAMGIGQLTAGIGVRDGHMYAPRLMPRLGFLKTEKSALRCGFTTRIRRLGALSVLLKRSPHESPSPSLH